MGSSSVRRQGAEGRLIVAFDFDGTLTFRDSFMAYLAWRSGPWGFALGLLRMLPATLAWLVDRDRARLKAAAVHTFLRGVLRQNLEHSCAEFAETPLGGRLFRPDAEQCWAQWRARGALLVIVTASPGEIVGPFADRLGADMLVATRLSYGPDDRVLGPLEGGNCRGQEKVERLRALFGPDLELEAAYGDSSGDKEMLAIARTPGYRVFRDRPARSPA